MDNLTMRNILLKIEYKGTNFEGWQTQLKGRTIQGILKEEISKFILETPNLIGAGRTDSGVHALGQYANFKTSIELNTDQILYKLNRMLPDDIVILQCREVSPEFNARRSATGREYRYLITERLSAVDSGLSWIIGRRLDLAQLNKLARLIWGERDFSNFCKVKSRKIDNKCIIIDANWRRYGGKLIFEISGNRFLHNMVRLLIGSMIAVCDGKMEIGHFRKLVKNEMDDKTKYIAPADGLYLVDVKYEGIN
jgi:tRNA pseudouridine38-40 synthase